MNAEDEAITRIDVDLMLSIIPVREAAILVCIYGLKGCPKMSKAEIGRALGVSRERIAQLQRRALWRIRGNRLTFKDYGKARLRSQCFVSHSCT